MACSPTADNTFGPRYCDQFDFTLLFEQAIFQIPPCALLILSLPSRARHLRQRSVKIAQSGRLASTLKAVALALFAATQLALLVAWSLLPATRTNASIPAAILSFLAAVALLYLSNLEHVRSVRPSSTITLYTLSSLLLDVPQARTLWMRSVPIALPIIFTIGLLAKLVVFALENGSKRRFLLSPYSTYAPEVLSGIYGRVVLWWLNPLFLRGYRGLLSFNNLFTIDQGLSSARNQDRFARFWSRRKSPFVLLVCIEPVGLKFASTGSPHSRLQLVRVVVSANRLDLATMAMLRAILAGFKISQPLLTHMITSWLAQNDGVGDAGRGLIGLTALLYVGMAVVNAVYKRQVDRLDTKTRGMLVSAIYAKALRLPASQLGDRAALSLLSIDTQRICSSIPTITELFAAPLEIACAITLLQRQVGICALAPVILSLGLGAISFANSAKAVPYQKKWLAAVQDRIAYTTAVLGCPKSFRMLGLTETISRHIQDLRVHELSQSAAYRKFVTLRNTLGWLPDALAPVTTLTVFVLINGTETLDPSMAFTTLSLVALLSTPIHECILAVPEALKALASFDRIDQFLAIDDHPGCAKPAGSGSPGSLGPSNTAEVELSAVPKASPISSENPILRLTDVTVCLDDDAHQILTRVSLSACPGTLTCIVGPVGSGKTTLLRVIIGDMVPTGGLRHIAPMADFAYCAQEPWLPNKSIRDIIHGQSFPDDDWYQSVVRVCQLESDISSFPTGDDTVIGSKGFSLSGGQKQRICLARALYSRKRIIVLDDVTSGLDAKLSKALLRNLRQFCSRQNVTAFLATHTVTHLHYADHIIVLDQDGAVAEEGSLALLNSYSNGYVRNLKLRDDDEKEEGKRPGHEENVVNTTHQAVTAPDMDHETVQSDLTRQTGDFAVYKFYMASIGWRLSSMIILTAVTFAFGRKFPELWVRWWSEAAASSESQHPLALWTSIYYFLGLVSVASIFSHLWIYLVWTIPKSSAKLHQQLLTSVMNAPYSFFVTVDAGVTLTRFVNDMSLIEDSLAGGVVQTLVGIGLCSASAILITTGAEYAGATLPFVIGILYVLQSFYLRTSRQLRLLELEAQAPLLAHFEATLEGVTTIRAFSWQKGQQEQAMDLLDRSQRPYYLLLCVQRWLNFVLDLITAAMAAIVVGLAIALPHTATSSSVGLSLLNILGFNTQLSYLIVAWTTLETSLGAVARCKSFEESQVSEHLPGESIDPPPGWPTDGHLEVSSLTASYTTGVPVLQEISLSVPAGAKVGICGRSGSGKSSLLLTFFRMLDATSGTMKIDGLDIATLRRAHVRDRLTALPQDLLSLPGTIQSNLDPLETSDVASATAVLRKVGLLNLIESRGGLGSKMADLSLSQGEMQLFAVARALLRPSKLLIVDEMTSAVDAKTEELMMDIIRSEFKTSTVIAVAHRLHTIVNFDLVVVMNDGHIVESGPPQTLLKKTRGWFRSMVDSGH